MNPITAIRNWVRKHFYLKMEKSPHWRTASYESVGRHEEPQFLVCDKCGYREENTALDGARCSRNLSRYTRGRPLMSERCKGNLRGAVTKGW